MSSCLVEGFPIVWCGLRGFWRPASGVLHVCFEATSLKVVLRAPKKTEHWDFSELTTPVVRTVNKYLSDQCLYVEQSLVQDLVLLWLVVRWWGSSYISLPSGRTTMAWMGWFTAGVHRCQAFLPRTNLPLIDQVEKWALWWVWGLVSCGLTLGLPLICPFK